MRGAGDGVMDRSRETLAREGRNGLASHALFATAPAPYSTVPGSCLRHVGERKEYHRLCPWDTQAGRRACLRGRKLPNPLGCWCAVVAGIGSGVAPPAPAPRTRDHTSRPPEHPEPTSPGRRGRSRWRRLRASPTACEAGRGDTGHRRRDSLDACAARVGMGVGGVAALVERVRDVFCWKQRAAPQTVGS